MIMMTAITNIPTVSIKESQKRVLLLVCVYLFPIILTFLLYFLVVNIADINTNLVSNKTQFAHIEYPKSRTAVSNKFEISGSTEKPQVNHSFYLIEFRNKLFWPKYDLGSDKSTWKKSLTFRAGKQKFSSYKVIMVDASIKKQIDLWFKTSQETNKYPGIPHLPLDSVVANIRVKSK